MKAMTGTDKVFESLLVKTYGSAPTVNYSITYIILIALTTLGVIYYLIVYPFFLSPACHVPGPWYTNYYSIAQIYHSLFGSEKFWIRSLHAKYGPIVRTSHWVVSFDNLAAVQPVYGVRSHLDKPEFSRLMENFDTPNGFASPSAADHTRRRSRYATTYRRGAMISGTAYTLFMARTKRIMDYIREYIARDEPMDIFKYIHFHGIDCTTIVTSGTGSRFLEEQNLKMSQDFRKLDKGLYYLTIFAPVNLMIRFLPTLTRKILPETVVDAADIRKRVMDYHTQHYLKARHNPEPDYNQSVLHRLLAHKDYGTPDCTDLHIASEVVDHFTAGSTSTTAAITYVFWELARPHNAAFLDRIIRELWTIKNVDKDGQPTVFAEVDNLPYLDACWREALRLHTPSSAMSMRMTPEAGLEVCGFALPGGLQVGVSPYAMLHNPKIYTDPDRFDPSRWIIAEDASDEERQKLKERREAWMVFSHGPRNCVGKELAVVMMKLLLFSVLRNFEIRISPTQPQSEMQEAGLQALVPRGERCLLTFKERSGPPPAFVES